MPFLIANSAGTFGVGVASPSFETAWKTLKPFRVVVVVVPLLIQKPNAFPMAASTHPVKAVVVSLV